MYQQRLITNQMSIQVVTSCLYFLCHLLSFSYEPAVLLVSLLLLHNSGNENFMVLHTKEECRE